MSSTPEPELDFTWLDQLMGETPEAEQPEPAPLTVEDAPTMEIPQVQPAAAEPDLSEAPTMQIPQLSREQEGPDLLYSGVPEPPRPEPVSPPPPRQPRSVAKIGLILGIVAGALVMALVLGVFIWGMTLKKGDTIYPNVYVAGIHVGGMKRQEAVMAVDEAAAASYASSTLKVHLPDRTLSFNPEQTNVALDPEEAIEEAMAYGREGNPFAAVTGYFRCKSTEHYIDLQTVLNLDTDYIRDLIQEVADEIEEDPVEAQVRYDSSAEALVVDVGYPDRSLDVEGLYEVVYGAFTNGSFAPLTWDYDEVPCEPVNLSAYFTQYGTEPKNAWYDEEKRAIVASTEGFGFDVEAAAQQIASAAAGSQIVIELGPLEPEISTEVLEKEMFGTALFETSSEYVVNADRTNNLTLACAAIDGLILNPGDVFSFNEVVGERTAEKGYKAATVYSGGQSLQELGGGVCQVASTIYYATLHLNLEQVHREPHQFVVTYVPYGMDATVYWGHIDYQFKNTLSHPIRILANTENGSVNITFQGVRENDNTVKMEYTILETYPWQEVEELDETKEPGYRQVEVTPYTGYKVVTYKTILDAEGNEISRNQEAVSVYSKRDQKVVVGPEETNDPFDPDLWPDDNDDTQDPWEDGGTDAGDDDWFWDEATQGGIQNPWE